MAGAGSVQTVVGGILRRGFLLTQAFFGALTFFGVGLYLYGQNRDAHDSARVFLRQNSDYLLALAIHDNIEGIRGFLEGANESSSRVSYAWIDRTADRSRTGSGPFLIQMGDSTYGAVAVTVRWDEIISLPLLSAFLSVTLGFWIFSRRVYRKAMHSLTNGVVRPLERMSSALSAATEFSQVASLPEIEEAVSEVRHVRDVLVKAATECENASRAQREGEIDEALHRVAAQVAHDIRSPLTALEVIAGMLSDVSEDRREVLRVGTQRIRDIANNLVHKYRPSRAVSVARSENESCFLTPIVERLVSEKRWQFRDASEKHIDFRFGGNALGAFARVGRVEFQRVISNLLNNAIEALDGKGRVTITVDSIVDKALVQIQDDGRGIPPEVIKKLGEVGLSHGKEGSESGSGLGVHHAMQCAREWGGELRFRSRVGEGTTVSLLLPLAGRPPWHVERLALTANTPVVLVDDDPGMKAVWKDELKRRAPDWGGAFFCFEDPASFENEKLRQGSAWNDAIYLIDFELRGSLVSGLDLIQRNALRDRAILVTSRFDETEIQDRCRDSGISLLPKGMIALLSFEVREEGRPGGDPGRQSVDTVLNDTRAP